MCLAYEEPERKQEEERPEEVDGGWMS